MFWVELGFLMFGFLYFWGLSLVGESSLVFVLRGFRIFICKSFDFFWSLRFVVFFFFWVLGEI